MKKDKFIYDAEELELLEEIESGEWISTPLTQKQNTSYAQSVAYTKSLQEKSKPLYVLQ